MKIEKNKPKKGVAELPTVTKELITKLQSCPDDQLTSVLQSVTVWRYGKCELYHWIDVLNRFDEILEAAAIQKDDSAMVDETTPPQTECIFLCPQLNNPEVKDKVLTILNFTSMLIEHSYSRYIYNSTEHLCVMLGSPDLDVVLAVLNLFYVFSKRSNFITRLPPKKRSNLNSYLEYLGETWGGKQNGFGLAECCQNVKKQAFPDGCTTVYFEYQPENDEQNIQLSGGPRQGSETMAVVLEDVDMLSTSIPELMADVTSKHRIPQVKQMQLLTHLRLAKNFSSFQHRLKCVMARLQAISVLVYSTAPQEVVDPLIYEGFVEELVEVLEIRDSSDELVEIKAAVLRTLTAIIHLERDPRLNSIIEATGATSYHGFLPTLVRESVTAFITGERQVVSQDAGEQPLSFATSLFSFLYHMATYETTGDALVSSGIMESLLQVLDWKAYEPMNITLVTRAVRVIDLITGLDISAFHSLGGWDKMLNRLEMEVSQCKEDAPTILPTVVKKPSDKDYSAVLAASAAEQESMNVEVTEEQRTSEAQDTDTPQEEAMDVAPPTTTEVPPTVTEAPPTVAGTPPLLEATCSTGVEETLVTCMPERVALIKSILNFLKKVIPEPTFAENIRNLVDSSLPESLKHLVSNAEYYGPSIYLPATEVITVFIFHEPSQLSTLQDNGLPWVMLNSIINKHIPVTREVLASLPSILSALCLNTRGLEVFIKAEPFDHLFGVLISPEYLPAMRKKKGTDQIGDTATNLGEAMDELMRHQPSLRTSVLAALVKLLKRLVEMGEKDIEEKRGKKPSPSDEATRQPPPLERKISLAAADDSSDSEKEDEEDGEVGGASGGGQEGRVSGEGVADDADALESGSEKSTPPVTEYVVNVVRFLDAILSQNNTDDHMQEFIKQGGLEPMIKLLAITPLAAESTYASANTAIIDTCRNILQIARAPELFVESMTQLSSHLKSLEHFLKSPEKATSSVLLDEVGYPTVIATPPTVAMPILHCLISVNEFIQLFVHLARASQAMYNLRRENVEFRVLCVNQWSTTLGLSLLKQLSRLYRALVWEGFILLAVAANEDSKELESDSKISIPVRDPTPESGSHSTVDEARTGSRETIVPSQRSVEAMDTSTSSTQDQPSISIATMSSTEQMDDSNVVKSKIPSLSQVQATSEAAPSLTDSLKQLTPLLTITSRVGRSLAELINLLIRLSTSPLFRTHRRGPGHTIILNNYQPPSEDAIAICKEVTNMLVESMNWEVPMPQECSPAMQSPIRDWLFAGMTFKMYAVDFCELVLFDEQKQALHLMMHSFDKEVALDALVGTFHSAMKIVDSINQNGSLLGSCIDFLEAWLNLAEKLANSRAILYSPHGIPLPPTTHPDEEQPMYHPLFNPLAFVIQAQKAIFPCIKELWKSPQLPKLSPKVVELLLSTASHFYRSEDIIQKKLELYFFDDDEDFLASLRAEAAAQSASNTTSENAPTDTTNAASSGGTGGETGTSGEASTTGTTGMTGTSAATGETGTSEVTGTSSTTGVTGMSEATDTSSTTGVTRTSEATGTSSTTGVTGTSEATGTSSTTGITGTSEAAGTASTTGTEQQTAAESSPTVRPPRVDPLYLGQLCDMGFSREQAERALLVCGNDLPTAMEWILTRHPAGAESTSQMSEDEQLMQAIALSLGQEVTVDDKAKEEEETKKKEKEEKELKKQKERELMTPVSKVELDEFSDILLAGCLELCVSVSDSVAGICDLISAVGKRNEDEWREKALVQIKEKVMVRMRKMCEEIAEGRYTIPEVGIDVDYSLVLFLTMCMEEMPIPCARCVCDQDLLTTCINLCHLTQSKLCPTIIPRWLSPLLLLLEMWEGTATMVKWASYPKKYHLIIWQSFENNRWITYSHDYSQMLEHAYQRGERSVFLKTTRTRYENNQRCVIQLRPMLQVNPDTGMQRPILRMEVPKKSQLKTASPEELMLPPVVENPCPMSEEQSITVLKCCTHLLSSNLDPDTLHSNFRLCLRLTRNPELASIFIKEGGPQAILSLTHKSAFRGFASFATLIFRHCLDDSFAIKHAIDLAMKNILTAPPMNPKEPRIQGTGAGGARARDLYYVLRRLGSFACRCPELVSEAACKYLGLSSLPPRPEHYIVSHRVPPTPIKLRSTPKYEPGPVTHLQSTLINMLIDHLCAESFSDEEASKSPDGDSGAEGASGANDEAIKRVSRMSFGGYSRRGVGRRRSSHRRQVTDAYDDDDVSVDMAVEVDENGLSRQASSASAVQGSQEGVTSDAGESLSTSKAEEKLTEKPLISKVAVLRILAEIVDSYPPCAKLIADSSRKIKIDGQPPKDMTVLAFIFDHLLPASVDQVTKIPPIASLAKTFLQHIATSNHCPDAVAVLVTEFKAAFVRALALPESRLKHNRIRALTGLLSQITDYITASRGPVNPCHFTRLLIRKGIISDLARAPHSLNLNSSMLTGTVNSILKPLEALTKIVNQVASSMQRKAQGQKFTGAVALSSGGGGQQPAVRLEASTAAGSSRLGGTSSQGGGNSSSSGLPSTSSTTAAMVTESGAVSTVTVTAATRSTGETTTTTVSAGESSTVAGQTTPSSQTSTAAVATQEQDGSQASTSAATPGGATSLSSQEEHNISSILEATHESLIPLEEDPHDLEELVADEDMEHHQLLSEVVHLARELGRVDQVDFVSDIIEEAMESVGEDADDSGGDGGELGMVGMEDTSMDDSDLASVSDDDEEEEEEDEEIYDDNCNSAGEEVEDDEYDNSHLDTSREEEFVDPDLSDAESTQDEEEEEEEEEDTEVERSAGESGAEEESTAESSDSDEHDAHSSGREEGDEESHSIREDTPSFSPLPLGASVLGEGVEGEDVEGMEEEEGDDDVLDFEYEFDDDDDEGADYDLSWRDADIDLHPHGALPSLFTRAFHSRPTQPTPSDLLEQTSVLSRLLPMQHPLLVHRTDYQIHHATPQTPGGGGGPVGNLQANTSTTSTTTLTPAGSSTNPNIGGRGNESDPQQPESAMQQLLTNISAATGSSELLGFGVGGSTSSGAERARTPQGNSGSSSSQQQMIDDGLESTIIPSTFTRWEEESAAIDGHMPVLVMRALREDILKHWIEEYEKENAPKEDQNKTTTTASGSTSTSSVTGGEQSSASATSAAGQSSQGESSSAGATVGDSTPGTITVPNPSDEATPSSHSPRDQNSVVDQLRSGLRQVADALAQTVAAVRSTQAQLRQNREETTAGVAAATSSEGTSEEMAVSEPQRKGEERERDGEENRGEEMESQSASVAVEATGEELTTPMEEGSSSSGSEATTSLAPPPPLLLAPSVQEQPQQESSSSPVPSPGGSQSQSTTTPTVTLNSDILSTFDGSQESAVATLANMDPQHPMYTYISAVAGAPAPPLPAVSDSASSSTLAPPTSQASQQLSPVHTSPLPPPPVAVMTTPTTGTSQPSPRLPVFAQFQQQSDTNTSTNTPTSQSNSQSSIPMSVIQDARSLSTTSSTDAFSLQPRDEATGATPLLPPQATHTPMGEITPANIESLAADVASQVSSFFAPTSLPSQETTLPSTASLTNHLAEELARAVSQLVPTSSGGIFGQPATSTSTVASTTASGSSLTVQSQHLQPQSMQSPSPSDTLSPLLSSLQMPQGGNGTRTETTAGARTETGMELASSEANVEQDTPANFVTVTSGAAVAHPSITRPTGTATISYTPSEGEVVTQIQSPQPRATVAMTISTSTTTGSAEATASSSEARMDSSSQETGESSSAQTLAATLSNQQGETPTQAEGQDDGAQAMASSEHNQLPEIDPSFLAALPDSIRQEVLAQHEREQRRLRAQREGATLATTISPEFLAALPLNIQEEVIQQERVERAQLEARQTNPTDPIDNAAFFYNLPRDLRRTILADMDDSLISHLPEDIATEARQIRQERESRRRQMMEQRQATFMERLMEEAHMRAEGMPPPSWHHIDSSDVRYSIVNMNPPGHHHHLPFSSHHSYRAMFQQSVKAIESGSKQMLDQEALTCLLVLLFLDQNKLHNNRLHRIVKNVSQHQPTRAWILSSLLTIIRETNVIPTALPTHPHLSTTCPMPPPLTPKQGSSHDHSSSLHGALVTSTPTASGNSGSFSPLRHSTMPHWLNLSINAALGSHTKVFRFEHSGKVGPNAKVHVHPLAAVSICGNVLELLIFLARQFPSSFLPSQLLPKDTKDKGSGTSGASTSATANASATEDSASEVISNFWQILLKLDGAASRKGKGALKSFQYSESTSHWQENEMFSASIMGQLLALFQNDLIKNSVTLTDKLLRALSVASSAIPKAGLKRRQQQDKPAPNVTTVTTPSGTSSVTMVEGSSVTISSDQTGSSVSVSQRTESEDVFESAKAVESSVVKPQLVKVLVGVLTSGRCSEDGLEDATVLLTNLSKCSVATRELILVTLLDGVKTCGQTLCSQISSLFEDLILNMESLKKRRKSAPEPSGAAVIGSESRGEPSTEPTRSSTGPSRFNALAGVVLPSVTHEQQHIDRSKDLHLPSMLPLHCKGSQQSFFLRMLKVVCQLRESAQAAFAAQKRAKLLAEVQVVPQIVPEMPLPSSGEGGGEDDELGIVPGSRGEVEQDQEMDTSQSTAENATTSHIEQSQGGESSSTQQVTQSRPEAQAEGGAATVAGPASTATTPMQQQTQEPESDESQQDKFVHQSLSQQLELDELWSMLSECLSALAETQDPHAVLVLQPSVEAFFLVHADHSEEVKQQLKKRSSTSVPRTGRLSSFHTIADTESNPASPAPALLDALSPIPSTPSDADFDPYAHLPPDTVRFLKFAEKHRTVLNQILRQSTIPLSEGPFAVLVNHTRVLDFDIKRRYFRHELDQMEDGLRRDDVVLHIRRDHIFEDSFRELYRRTADELKGNLYIQFQGEEGQDVGGLLREWYLIMAREMFNPNYALFKLTPGDQVTYMPNPSSHVNPNHLDYFKFIGRVIAKAIYDNKLLDAYFTRSFYKHILGKPVHFTDMEAEDYTFYQSMLFLLEHNLKDLGLDLTFSMEIQEFGKTETKDMKPDGQNIPVTEENKKEYVQLACQMKMTSSIRSQIKSFLEGFYEIIPKELISIFNEQELELLICGLPTIDIDDLKANTDYHKYTENSMQIQWFWRALRSFDQADRAGFIQFVTGTSKVPLQGFAALEGMNGVQRFQIHRDDRSTDRLPCAHTCFNQLDLPPYETYDKLHHMLLIASRECPEGFGFA